MKIKNTPKILIIMFVLLFFIMPVNAEIINGDFEDGETGWIMSGNVGGSYYGSIHATVGNASAGLRTLDNNGLGPGWAYQTIDLTYINTIKFDFWIYGEGGVNSRNAIGIGSMSVVDVIWESTTFTPQWISDTIDVSSYTGEYDIYFYSKSVPGEIAKIYWDNIIILDYGNSINYNPDILVSNTKPFNLSYTLNSTYADNPSYCEIYSYTGTDIGNETHPNIIWQGAFEGYVNQASGSFITSDYFHSYQWLYINVSYGVGLFNPAGADMSIRFPDIENDPNFLAKDQIYVHYNYSYPTPTPQPTPNMTELPTPTGSPTPGPSATPQPDPESINESLNTSFKQGYSNLVNTTIDGFYEPVYNFTYYIVSPLLGINDTLYNFSIHMNESFINSSSSLVLSSSILFLIMTNIPDKLINVMTYYLIWLIILLIFKGDA